MGITGSVTTKFKTFSVIFVKRKLHSRPTRIRSTDDNFGLKIRSRSSWHLFGHRVNRSYEHGRKLGEIIERARIRASGTGVQPRARPKAWGGHGRGFDWVRNSDLESDSV